MPLNRSTGDSRRKIVPAAIFVALVLFSGTNYVTPVFAQAIVSSNVHVDAATPITQLSLTEWGVPSIGGGPYGIGVDLTGKVWVTENSTSKIASFDPSNNNFTEWKTPTAESDPRNIFIKQVTVSGANMTQVFFTEFALNAIARFDVASSTFTEWHLGSESNPTGIYVDENNDIWFTESGRDAIGMIHPSGNNITEWTLPGATASPGSPLLKPWSIYIQVVTRPFAGTNRFVWFTESASNKIGRLEATSNRLTIWDLNSLSLGSFQPTDMTFGTVNTVPSIIFSNANGNRISILGNDTGGTGLSAYSESLVPTTGSVPTGMAFDALRSALWFGENNVGRIANFNTTTVLTPTGLAATYCTILPATGTPSCASPAAETKGFATTTVTPKSPATSQIQSPALTSTVGIFQGPINGVTEYSLPNRTARPTRIALDSGDNLWFTESNVTVNRIGRLGIPYNFQISASPNPQTVNKGQTATYTVNVALISGNPQPLQLTLINTPPGATTRFSPQTQNPTFVSTLTIATANSTPTGTFVMSIQGSSGGQNRNVTIALTVQTAPPPGFDYRIDVTSNSSVTVQQGQSASFDLKIALTSGSPQTVTLNATGFPPGTASQLTNSNGLPTFFSRLDVQTSVDTPAGSYPISVTGFSSGGVPHTPAQSPVLTITPLPRDFNLTSPVSQVILVQGSRADVPITVTAVGFFSSDVNFDATFSPSEVGLGAIFSPSPVTLQPNGIAQVTMEIIAFKNTAGTYQLTITGTSSSPSQTHTLVMNVRVSPCLIATATFGSELAPEVQFLRDFRDRQIMRTFAGSNFMEVFNAWYYSFSPAVAGYEYSHGGTRTIVKFTLYPAIGILHFASSTYAILGSKPEAGALIAGLVASSLIGLAYMALPLSCVLWVMRRKINAKTKRRIGKWITVIFVALMAGFVISESLALPVAMMAASAGLVLTVLLAGSFLPAFEIVEYAKRRT